MAKPEKEYRRLPGRGQSLASIATLWLGRDHLLLVESTGFSESYKRFYYRDIQAIVLRTTATGRVTNLVLAVLAAPLVAGMFTSSDGLFIFFGIMLGVLAALLLLNVALGPTSIGYLRTAVQTEKLGSLNRLRRARKALARIQPLIEQFQGTWSPEEQAAALHRWIHGADPTTPSEPAVATSAPETLPPTDPTPPAPAP